jgi:hypothetical protein
MKPRLPTALVFASILFVPAFARAQALGTDMWSGEFAKDAIYQPHINDCDSGTEAFVQMGANANRGFCIEKDERSSDQYQDARQTCAGLGKRLPEPVEFEFACTYGAGLNNMTNNYEWASNLPHLLVSGGTTTVYAVVSGNGSCSKASADAVADSSGTQSTNAFRCVR